MAGNSQTLSSSAQGEDPDTGTIYLTPEMDWERLQKRHVDEAAGYIVRKSPSQQEPVIVGVAGIKMDPDSPFAAQTLEARMERTEELRLKRRGEKRHYTDAPGTKSHLQDFF